MKLAISRNSMNSAWRRQSEIALQYQRGRSVPLESDVQIVANPRQRCVLGGCAARVLEQVLDVRLGLDPERACTADCGRTHRVISVFID